MDKNAIKKFAVWARRELIERVSQRAMIYGITAKDTGNPEAESVNGRLLTPAEKQQRQALIHNIQEKGYTQVMEEVAYTWFNRFAALRFMEVNGYLPSHIRVFTNDAGEFKPQILAEAIHLELDGLDMNKVYELESANKSEELFKYLLIVQCNALNSILPGMFQRIEDYTELLLPDYLLREGSVIEQMVTTIPEEDWTDQVQIIGWLYQYYNTEPKDKVFSDLKKKIRVSKKNIPAATQLFTPDWIVHYMVENSLGRLWLEGHPNDALKSEWKYYLDEAEQKTEVQLQLDTIRKEYAALKPEEIRVIDPCMGSGHILCVLFDTLVRIYEDYGFTAREAAAKIVENNLWGLDIDERAAQLSYFTVMMKARQYDRRFFTRKVQPHVYAIEESNGIRSEHLKELGKQLSEEERSKAYKQAKYLVEQFFDAKEYGSAITLEDCDWNLLYRFSELTAPEGQMSLDVYTQKETSERLEKLIMIAETLASDYSVVVTNPPYMNSGNMNAKLTQFVKENYPDSKTDMFSVFIERGCRFLKYEGFLSMITMQSWMFLGSFETFREKYLKNYTIVSLLHLGIKAFEEIGNDVVQTVCFTIEKRNLRDYRGLYFRLLTHDRDEKQNQYLTRQNMYLINQQLFFDIPGQPIAYWVGESTFDAFISFKKLGDVSEPKQGIATADNNRFLRLWQEVPFTEIGFGIGDGETAAKSTYVWFPYQKGGDYRKWYGNNNYVVLWKNNGEAIKNFKGSVVRNPEYHLREGLSWTWITTGYFGARFSPQGSVFDVAGSTLFASEHLMGILAYLCSNVADYLVKIINPTINFSNGVISKLPITLDLPSRVEELSIENVELSVEDWDSFETSWDFKEHPFITSARLANRAGKTTSVEKAFEDWKEIAEARFCKLKKNEEELNRIFIDIFSLSNELTPEVEDKDVTVRKADLQREIRSFISYAVGCMFGRYTLGEQGLIYAGGEWDASKYTQFQPDKDAIIPICDDEYFEDDIVGRFISFTEKAFGKETLEENLRFIANALGGKGSSRDVIRNYFINEFYGDHCSTYSVTGSGKRPIYWLFDSGKKNGFKCLVYMHRYQPDTIARIRTDYVHEQQSRYRTAITDLEQRINGASTSERVKLSKRLATLQAQAEEIRLYEEKIHHLADQMIKIDLDDGVKVNYAKFEDVLAKIK